MKKIARTLPWILGLLGVAGLSGAGIIYRLETGERTIVGSNAFLIFVLGLIFLVAAVLLMREKAERSKRRKGRASASDWRD